ncbi:fluoride efflux transporter CrcB [Lysobacter sp. A3-1-A15]|uniref:fluoride efflux transporter CrcB n=1 Tax=Novilysobacter viscosus TaxID=3098602 RepID=UPI002ED79CCA
MPASSLHGTPSMNLHLLYVGLGGAIGAMARHLLGGWVLHHTAQGRFPAGTFAVNVLGCLLIGVLAGLAERHAMFPPPLRVFLFTGLLGGFTTFSAFGLETLHLLRRGEAGMAAAYVLGSVLVGLAAVWIGFRLVGGPR